MKIKVPKYDWQYYKFGSISLCMIMRDNEKTLSRCLNSIKEIVDEVIIVDTGSKDNSIHLARSWGCKVLQDPWKDDFSRPRNISLSHATKQWILIMDPDEVILKKDHEKIRWLTRSKNVVAVRLTTRNYSRLPYEAGYRTLAGETDPTGQFHGFVPSTKTRFFKNGLGICFKGCWHELVDWYIIHHKLPVGSCSVPVHHWGHEISQASVREKGLFYLRLGEKKVKEWPTNGQAWWELAVAEAIQGMRGRALQSLAQAFKLGFGSKDQYFLMSRILNMINRKEEGRFAFEKGICNLFTSLTHIDIKSKPLEALLSKI